jgi:methionyl-tRNA formyltransferase
MILKKIGFVGQGWGALSAIKSLNKFFFIEFVSEDEEVIKLIGENGLKINSFSNFSVDIIICAGYKPIIEKKYTQKYNILNIHYSLLPRYRGLHAIPWAIINGENKLGWTLHQVNEFIDDGSIIHQKSYLNDHKSSATFYMKKINDDVEKNLALVLKQYLNKKIVPIIQDFSNATWVAKRKQHHNFINFEKGFEYCRRLQRVLQTPYPNPIIDYRNDVFAVTKLTFEKRNSSCENSRILNVDKNGVWVGCPDGYILLLQIKDLVGNRISYSHFIVGTYINV